MFSLLLEIGILFVLFGINAIFSLAEIAIVTSHPFRLKQLANKGSQGAKKALSLAENPTRFLSTIQIGITLVGIIAGAFGGARLTDNLSRVIENIPFIEKYSTNISFIVIVITLTYFSIVLGELVPKRIALSNPEKIAIAIAPIMEKLSRINGPIVDFLTKTTESIVKVFGIQRKVHTSVSEEEVKDLIAQGARVGVFEQQEHDMVEGVFELSDRLVGSLMTPRSEIHWIDINDPLDTITQKIRKSWRSRFPVCDGGLEKIVGILRSKDWYKTENQNKSYLKSVMQKPLFVPENLPSIHVLREFKSSGTHLAMVIDEYGEVVGMVTLTDVFEAIVGEMPSQDDPEESSIIERKNGTFLIDGMLPIEEFIKYFDIDALSENDDSKRYQTLGGFIMSQTGDIPSSGDIVNTDYFQFEVVDMDGKRVDKILVSRMKTTPKSKEK